MTLLFSSSFDKEDFFISGVTTALLKPSGTAPSNKEQFTSFVIEGSSISRQSLTRKVGQGSRRQDFVGEFLITFTISSGETSSNLTSPGRFTGDDKEKDEELEKDSRILAILLVKKAANCSANFFVNYLMEEPCQGYGVRQNAELAIVF